MRTFTNKALGILLTVLLLSTVWMPAMAAETGTIVGDSVLLAPPAGVFTTVPHSLQDASGNPVTGTTWSLEGTVPAGVYVSPATGDVVLDGTNIQNGSFTLKATNGTVTATKDMTIPDARLYFDFQDNTVGSRAAAYGTKLSDGQKLTSNAINGKAVAAAETDGNIYVNSTADWGDYYSAFRGNYVVSGFTQVKSVTMDFDVKTSTGGTATIVKSNAASGIPGGEFVIQTAGNSLNIRNADGTYSATGYTINPNAWTNIKVVLDYANYTYSIHAGAGIYGPYDMRNQSNTYLGFPLFGRPVDNVALYSGTPVAVGISGELPAKIAVGSKEVKLPLDVMFCVGHEKLTAVTWELEGTDVTVENGYLVVPPTSARGVMELTAKAGPLEKTYQVEIVDALEKDFAEEPDGYFTGDVTIPAGDLGGRATVKARVRGANAVLKGLGTDILIGSRADSFSDVHVFLDTAAQTYLAVCDSKTIGSGTYSSLSDVVIAGGEVDDVYCGNLYEEAPMALDVRITGNAVIGASVSADYTYYSALGALQTAHTTTWYLADRAVGTGDHFLIGSSMVNQQLQAEVAVSGGGLTSTAAASAPVQITDMYSAVMTETGADFTVINTADDMTFLAAAAWIKNGTTERITAKRVSSAERTISVSLTAPCDFDAVRVWLLHTDLSPLAISKHLGTGSHDLQASGKTEAGISYENGSLYVYDTTGQMATVIIYKPLADNDFINCHNSVSASVRDTDWTDKVLYMDVTNADFKLSPQAVTNGIHMAQVIPASGTAQSLRFVAGAKALFTDNILANIDSAGFAAIMENCLRLSAEKSAELYGYYQKADKADVAALMQAEDYDMDNFEVAVLLSAFLQDKTLAQSLTTALADKSLPTTGVTLLAANNDFAASSAQVVLSGGISAALTSMKEQAILQGVAKAGNYLETKTYLQGVGSYTITDDMALAFTGRTFTSLSALETAIAGYTPSGSGGGAGGGSVSGGYGGGHTGSGGFTAVGGSSSPTDSMTSSVLTFHDVSRNHWAYDAIHYLVDKKVLNGISGDSFAPDSNVTRAEYVKILSLAFPVEQSGEAQGFADVKSGDWFYEYVNRAAAAGIVTGDGTNFRPHDTISRQDAAVMLYRVLSSLDAVLVESTTAVTDSDDIAPYAREAVNVLYAAGIMNGFEDGSFMPEAAISRAQAAAIVARVLQQR